MKTTIDGEQVTITCTKKEGNALVEGLYKLQEWLKDDLDYSETEEEYAQTEQCIANIDEYITSLTEGL